MPWRNSKVDAVPTSPSFSNRYWQIIDRRCLELSKQTLGANVTLTRRVQQLEEELSVWKQARTATVEQADRDKRQHEDEKAGLLRRISNLEMQQVRPLTFSRIFLSWSIDVISRLRCNPDSGARLLYFLRH